MKEPVILAEIRVLGICSKLIWVPLWNILEDKNISVAHLGAIYQRMLEFFERNATDPTDILEGLSPFEDSFVDRDSWMQCLLDPDEATDVLTASIMSMTMASFCIFTRRQFAEFLPGGKHADMTEEQARGIPKTNKKPESYFAYWDRDVS